MMGRRGIGFNGMDQMDIHIRNDKGLQVVLLILIERERKRTECRNSYAFV